MMKHTLLYISAAALAMSAALTSCDDNFVHPPVIMPPTENLEPTTTLADIKTQYWSSVADQSPVTIGKAEDGGDLIFSGRVCSSDADGNFYKSVVIQSVDADGVQTAINFSVDDKAIYKLLPYGQEVAVYATGLSVGGYKNLMQFGSINGNEMTFMDVKEFTAHVVRNNSNLPEPEKVLSTETTISELIKAKNSNTELMKWQSRMVTLKDVRWAEAGFSYAGGGNVTRYLVDAEGNIMPVRNSGSSTFKNDILPAGTGTVSGVLSYYSTDWQMVIVNTDAVQGFEPTEGFPGVAAAGTGTAADPYNVTAAYAAAQNKPAGQYYIKGKVLLVTEFSESYGNASYNIVDENGAVILYVYRGNGVGGAKFTAATCPKPGDEVTIKGELTVFSGNPQINQGSELVAGGGDTPTPPVGDETPSGSGTEADPYNAVAAIQAANAGSTDEVYVKGVITAIEELSTQYGNVTYSVADAVGGTSLKIYRGYWLGGDKFTAQDQLAVGAQVVVKGKLTVYNGAPQIGTGSRVISYNGEGGGDTPTPPVGGNLTYTKVSTITSGAKYAMVVDGQYGARIEPESYAYGRLNLTDATISGDKLTAPATAAITITEVAGKGYTMVDSYGRYLAMASGYKTNFQLHSAVDDGCYWSITFDGENAVITNKLVTDCTVCVSKGAEGTYYTNIAPAAGAVDPKLPVLYKAD